MNFRFQVATDSTAWMIQESRGRRSPPQYETHCPPRLPGVVWQSDRETVLRSWSTARAAPERSKRRSDRGDCPSGRGATISLGGCETERIDTDERNRELDDVLIGGREQRKIVIVEYDPRWPARFESERVRVQQALGASAIRVEHIGSTAVPRLAAKPIIDLLATVEDPDDETASVPALTAVGYELRVREPGHRMFRTPERDVHVHLWGDADPEVTRYLRLRDQLRRCAEDRQAYEQLKRELARREWSDMNHYADAKGPLIEEILARVDA